MQPVVDSWSIGTLADRQYPSMAVTLDKFVQYLEESGILPKETLKEFLPPKSEPKDAEDLARELVRRKKLTKFQAEEAYKGKAKSLVLGNYVLMEKIGAGGMGQVFKALHRRMDRMVAVKLLPNAMSKDKDAIARFEREVKAAAKLSHPNIVAAFDADQANGAHFLVMELVEGSDLSALVKKNGPFSQDKAVNYILQAAKGLEAAHAEGIVHRDIKPSNLLLDKKGTVKILDMGLARLKGEGDATTQAELTSTGAVMGTVDYMSPEQAENTKSADARADIYALGCSLYFLLTGKAAYQGDSLMAKLIAHREFPIPALRASCPHAPEPLQAIFSKMVAKKVEDRYQTMTTVIADLDHWTSVSEPSGVEEWSGTNGPSSPTQVLPVSSRDAGPFDFRKDLTVASGKSVLVTRGTTPQLGKDQKQRLLIGGGVLGVLGALVLAASIVISLQTKDGTLVVTVNEPGSKVEVFDEQGKVEITRKGVKEKISISVDPGKHRLKVSREGFEFFAKDFEIESGEEHPVTARLVPLEDRPAAATTTPPNETQAVTPLPAVKPSGAQPPLAIAPFGAKEAKAHQEAWAKHLGLPVEFANTLGMKFRLIPPGEFSMGCDAKQIDAISPNIQSGEFRQDFVRAVSDSMPRHSVRITRPFYMQTHEVTNGVYQKLLGKLPEDNDRAKPEMPVMANITLVEATAFCDALSQEDDKTPAYRVIDGKPTRIPDANGYRLPTEAEWEYACRAGTTTVWNFGDDVNIASNFGLLHEYQTLHRGAEAKPNPFGLFDLYGGSSEWCFDRFQPYGVEAVVDPFTEPGDSWGVARGGNEFSGGGVAPSVVNSVARMSARLNNERSKYMGFGRVVLPIEMKTASDTAQPAVPNSGDRTEPQRKLAAWLLANKHDFQTDAFASDVIKELPPGTWKVEWVNLINLGDSEAREFADLAAPLGTVLVVSLHARSDFSAAGLSELARIKSLQQFDGSVGSVTGAQCAKLVDLPELTQVDIGDSIAVDDAVMEFMKRLPKLTRLGFNACPITDKGVAQLPEMPQLTYVYFNTPHLTDSVWDSLARLPKVEKLVLLLSPNLTGKGVSKLRQEKLTILGLGGDGLVNDSLQELAMLHALRELDISNNPLDDEGLAHLSGTRLVSLNLKGTNVSENGVKKLAATIPACRIEWDKGIIEPTEK